SITYISKIKFFLAFYITFKEIIIKANIKGGFNRASITPFNLEVIILKLNI
ncbi:hypothetical protein FOC4_g10012450, partial [Fusarium odoratissimum]